ncbi:MAG: alpha/beta hydrolase [Proteobacteria bacterium]|nr:alpha/beta hydrolase [Pseudomonadota bacterium]
MHGALGALGALGARARAVLLTLAALGLGVGCPGSIGFVTPAGDARRPARDGGSSDQSAGCRPACLAGQRCVDGFCYLGDAPPACPAQPTRPCSVARGSGTQTCARGVWGACVLESCDDAAATPPACGFTPRSCAGAPRACAAVSHQLPLPTHFSAASGGASFLATDPPELMLQPSLSPDYTPGLCYRVYNYGLIPDVDDYPAATFTTEAPSNASAEAFAAASCAATGVPLEHRRPPTGDGVWASGAPTSNSCRTQVIHASIADHSLYTVFLPPNWSADAPAATYPILFNGQYDLHANTFSQYGSLLARVVSESGLQGRRGVIGVLWNGGGAAASRTTNERALAQFAAVIAQVVERYHGNPQWIVTFGASRGGGTALAMAANPNGAPYRVVLAAAQVPPTLLGDHARLGTVTYPALLGAVSWSTGLADAWLTGWTYPSCAGRPALTGLRGWQAHLHVLVGTTDPAVADTQHSLLSERFLGALQRAGTQIYLEIGEHDHIVPYPHQVRYATALRARGLPAQVEVVLRGGHGSLRTTLGGAGPAFDYLERLVRDAGLALANSAQSLQASPPALVTPGLRFHRVRRGDGATELVSPAKGNYPFAIDVPWIVAAGTGFPVIAVGEPGTLYEFSATHVPTGAAGGTLAGTIAANHTREDWVELPVTQPLGAYRWALRIQRPGEGWQEIPSTATPTGALCTTEVIPSEPPLTGDAASAGAQPPTVPGYAGTNWGLSEY